jgi:plastocyanin
MKSVSVDESKLDGALWLAAGLSLAAGLIHLWVSMEHFAEWWGYGLFFIWAGLAQIAYALTIFVLPWMSDTADAQGNKPRATMRVAYLIGAGGNAVIIALYVITRTVGIPFVGPSAGAVETMTPLSVITTAAELILVGVLLWLAHESPHRNEETSRRGQTIGIKIIAVLGIGFGLLAGMSLWLTGQDAMADGAMAIAPSNRAALAPLADLTEVRIDGFAFTPANVTIKVGATVRWENFDPLHQHTVTSVNPVGLFDSGTLVQGDSFQFQFTKPGVYSYHCSFHSIMTGTVTVIGAVAFLPIVMR